MAPLSPLVLVHQVFPSTRMPPSTYCPVQTKFPQPGLLGERAHYRQQPTSVWPRPHPVLSYTWVKGGLCTLASCCLSLRLFRRSGLSHSHQ